MSIWSVAKKEMKEADILERFETGKYLILAAMLEMSPSQREIALSNINDSIAAWTPPPASGKPKRTHLFVVK